MPNVKDEKIFIAILLLGGALSGLSGCRKKKHPDEDDRLKIFFEDHVRNCTEINWKYWIFSWYLLDFD